MGHNTFSLKDAASVRTEVLQLISDMTLDFNIGWIWHLRTCENEQHYEPILHSTRRSLTEVVAQNSVLVTPGSSEQ